MKCPKCLGRLAPIKVGSVELDRCYVCEGLWFDPNELEDVIERHADMLVSMNLDNGAFDGFEVSDHSKYFDSKKGECPVCGMKMIRQQYEDITADYCPEGHGAWLDGGEILLLTETKDKNYFELLKVTSKRKGFKSLLKAVCKKKSK